MRRLCAISVSSLLFVSANSVLADESMVKDEIQQHCTASDTMTQRIPNHMFDGVELTELQRQQMRDLTDQFRFRHSTTNIRDIEQMQKLTLSPNFDITAVRQQAQKLADQQVEFQVEMAHVRNQMYELLTPKQKLQVQQNYEHRIDSLCDVNGLQ